MLVAVQNGDLDLVKYHLNEGIDINYEHPELMTTALIESISYNHLAIASYLLDHGADPTQKAWISDDDPLKMAKEAGNPEMIKLIKGHLPRRKSFISRLFGYG